MSEAIAGLPEPPPPPEPRAAAAVILWREGPDGREVFWVQRGEPMRFAGGFHAFPGGRLDEADRRVPVPGLGGEEAAVFACACRELFEETGVLAARGAERLSQTVRDAARRALLDEQVDFAGLLRAHGLSLDPAALAPAGRWVTPPFSPLRYDARLFVARVPEGAEPSVWPGELARGEFVAVSRALELWERGEALLHPPNLWGIACLARASPPEALGLLRDPPHCRDFVTWRIEFQKGIWFAPLRTPTLPPAAYTNAYLLDLGGSVAVVDPGSPWPEEQARLDAVLAMLAEDGLDASEIWLTHHHADHVGGLAPLTARGLPIRAHPLTASRISTGGVPVLPLGDGDLLHGRAIGRKVIVSFRRIPAEEMKRARESRNDPMTFFQRKPEDLKKDFDVTLAASTRPACVKLILKPKPGKTFEYKGVELDVNRVTWLPDAVRTMSGGEQDDWALYEFTKVLINTSFPDVVFANPPGYVVQEVAKDAPEKKEK